MTLPTQAFDTTGNYEIADAQRISWDSQLTTKLAAASQPYFLAGTGAPTFTAPKGSIYTRIDGSSTSTRLYVNTDGATTWTNLTSAA